MTVLGLPLPMFLVFAATILAGSLGAIHFTIVHLVMKRPFPDEGRPIAARDPGERTARASGAIGGTDEGGRRDG